MLIFWHGKCFSINNTKVNSYLKYRSRIIKNVMTTYFLKRKNAYIGVEKLEDREERCKQFPKEYERLKDIQNGILYYDGQRIDLEEFYKGKIVNINKIDDNAFDELFKSLLD